MEKYVVIGHDIQTNQEVAIGADGRARSTYVIGITGTGKSTLLENVACQDMENGDGLCFLDPHGDSAGKLLGSVPPDREHQVIFWDPGDIDNPFGLNPFFCHDPTNEFFVRNKAESFVKALGSLKEFAPIFESAPRMKDLLEQLAYTFIINQGHTLIETPEFLTNREYRRQFFPKLSGQFARFRRYWEEFEALSPRERDERIESSLNKLRRFQTDPVLYSIFGQPKNTINFRKAMDGREIIIVNLSADEQGFIGAFIVWEILQAARSRAKIPESERTPFHLFSDEFQTYMTTAFPDLQAQARKFGVDTVVAHQVREQLDPEIRELTRAVGNLIIFRITSPNANALSWEFDTTPPPAEPRQEVVTKPAYKRWTERVWDPPEAEKEFAELDVAYFRVMIEQHVLGLYGVLRPLAERFDAWSCSELFEGKSRNKSFMETVESERGKSHYDTNWHRYVVLFPEGKRFWWNKDDARQPFLDLLPEIELCWREYLSGKGDDQLVEYARPAAYADHPGIKSYTVERTFTNLPRYMGEPQADREVRYSSSERRVPYILTKEECCAIVSRLYEEYSSCSDMEKYDWFKAKVPWVKEQRQKTETQRDKKLACWKLVEKKEYLGYDEVETYKDTEGKDRQKYRQVPGTQKSSAQVAAEIANDLVGLANYQARCKLSQRHGRPTEHLIFTEKARCVGDFGQSERLRALSRQRFGRSRESVEREIEERLRTRKPGSQETRDEEPIIREKAPSKP